MAMYYQAGSSEQIQGDGLQTLYLMNPNYVGYNPDNTHHHQQPLLITSAAVPHAPLNQFVGIPISHDPNRPSSSSVLGPQEDIQPGPPTAIPRFHYGTTWGSIDQSDNGNQPNMPQGLSLSLSPHKTGFHKAAINNQDCRAGPGMVSPRVSTSTGADDMQSVILGSKYLKAAQELLDEVAGVGDAPKGDRPDFEAKNKAKMIRERVDTIGEDSGGGTELTTAQRQEIQMKRAKLSSMLDEVDQRYKQYHQQMQIIVASFEQAAGIGSAKSYTQLALKTILKQFKCLKTAISAQIKALSKSLGEEDKSLSEKIDGSRLKFVDHQMRQQRAFQHLGMMQNNNAWRPQRGLPERAVSVLRAWLFEHFLHPYPKDSDKHMLAKQTGLTRSQVSNWFINARVRLWKPMVEEMYLEEMKNQDQIPTDEKATKAGKESASEFTENNITTATMAQLSALQSRQNKNLLNLVNPSPDKISGSTITTISPSTGFAHRITSSNMDKNPKKPRNDQNSSPSSILSVERETGRKEFMTNVMFGRPDGENLLSVADANTGPGFGNYGIPTGNSFPGNSNFSLTLALPPSEGSQRAHQQNYLSHRNFEFGTRIGEGAVGSGGVDDQGDSHPNIGYEILDFQNRKQFPAQLLHDYVA